MFFGNIGLTGVCILGMAAVNLTMLYLTSFLVGVFQVIFFASFQLFMKDVDTDDSKPLPRVVGSYTLAWNIGMSLGPILTGFLMRLGDTAGGAAKGSGWIYAYLAAACLSLSLLGVMFWVVKKSRKTEKWRQAGITAPAARTETGEKPDLAWLGWTMAFLVIAGGGIIRGVFPSVATRAGMLEWRTGSVMTVLALAAGLFAYGLSWGRKWMYSGPAMLILAVIGTGGAIHFVVPRLAGWEFTDSLGWFYLGAVLFGGYMGSAYLYSGFHSLAHPEKAGRNIALNEFFVAGGAILGPLAGGWLARSHGYHFSFILAAALAIIVGVFQLYSHWRYGKCRPLRLG
ncbi:MAG: MFS transporter [Planctomycetes bacterium]|nr:MFS transporter [Planctomycetota bacterium]